MTAAALRSRPVIAGLRDRWSPTTAAWLALLALFVVSTIVSSSFLTHDNLFNVSRQAVALGIVALGQTIVILVGGIDVSVGALISLTTVVAGSVMQSSNARILPTVLLVLAIGVTVGLINGFLIAWLKCDAFVTTLATMLILQGATLVYTSGAPRSSLTTDFRQISEGEIAGLPVPVLAFVVIAAVVGLVMRRTTLGRMFYAVGGGAEASLRSGLPVRRVQTLAYVLCSVLAVVAGLFLVARLGTGEISAGKGWELEAIAAVLIGGTAFGGGRGGISGTIAGVLILTILFNLCNLLALPNFSELIVEGVAVIVGVSLYARRARTET